MSDFDGIHRFIFRVRERMFILTFEKEEGWCLLFIDEIDEIAMEAALSRNEIEYILLDPLPTDFVLDMLADRGRLRRFLNVKFETDQLEKEFVEKHAGKALEHVRAHSL